MICIKNVKYGGTYVPKEDERAKTTKQPAGDNALDAIKEDIARIQDELIKQNRDNLDAMYNIDYDNFSSSLKKTFGNALAQFQLTADDTKAQFEALAQWKTDTTNSIASIQGTADTNSATLESIASWQSGVNSSISSIWQTADSASATASMASQTVGEYGSRIAEVETKASQTETSVTNLVQAIGSDGSKLEASITVGIKNDETFIQAIANKVVVDADNINLNGYVKFTDLSDNNGTTDVSGNLINMSMYVGMGETSSYDADAGLQFDYACHMYSDVYGKIKAEVNGDNNSETESRYKLIIGTYAVRDWDGDYARHPGIKLHSDGRMSITSGLDEDGYAHDDGTEGSIYMATGGGYITMETQYGVRIRSVSSYSTCVAHYYAAENDYVFCTDGIYYNGTRIVST